MREEGGEGAQKRTPNAEEMCTKTSTVYQGRGPKNGKGLDNERFKAV